MNKNEARKSFLEYLKKEHIKYKLINEKEAVIAVDEIDVVYLSCRMEDVIGRHIETTIRFYENNCYCQSYYCQPLADTVEKKCAASCACNYLNLYTPWNSNAIIVHYFFCDDETGDIFNGCQIPYQWFDTAFDEVVYHILNYGVNQISAVCIPIVFYLEGKYTYEEFKEWLQDNLLAGC